MEVMQAEVGYVHLHILIFLEHAIFKSFFIELFLDFKEAFFDLLFDFRLQLFLHIVHFEVLAFKIL